MTNYEQFAKFKTTLPGFLMSNKINFFIWHHILKLKSVRNQLPVYKVKIKNVYVTTS